MASPNPPAPREPGVEPAGIEPVVVEEGTPTGTIAQRIAAGVAAYVDPAALPAGAQPSHGSFGTQTTGDTSGFGGLVRHKRPLISTPKPYGSWFDEAVNALERSWSGFGEHVERVVIDHGEITVHIRRDGVLGALKSLKTEPGLRFELLTMVDGVDYPADQTGRSLHVVYHLRSLTWGRFLRLETSTTYDDPHIPSAVALYPTADWQERETWDFFGIVFDGHPGLTRIMMPDDWVGHPQLKSYPLGGIPVEYHGATVPPPDERRSYA